jgi:4-hydroxybutyrate CoA-transferase
MTRWIEANEVPRLLRPGHRVYAGGSSNEPVALLAAIMAEPPSARDVTFIQQPLAINRFDLSELHPTARQETFFMTPALKDGHAAGRVDFIPMQMRTIFDYLARSRMDIALLAAAADKNGVLRFGPNVDYLDAALAAADCIVVEVSDACVAPLGCPLVDLARVDYLVASNSPAINYPVDEPDATSVTIGTHIARLIRDGDCLQTGIGAVPAAILANLGDKNDLGFHGGLIDDGVMRLIRQGNLTGSNKPIDQGRHLTGMALGSPTLLDWLSDTDSVLFKSANYTHEYRVIAQIPNFVSINSAIEIDLFGQVNAEMVAGRQISGTGGSVDFMRASKASEGGRSIVAMSATARGGTLSRIVQQVEVVTALRTDIDIVVTEFGVAELKNASLAERKAKLIAIAHPDFRPELEGSRQT